MSAVEGKADIRARRGPHPPFWFRTRTKSDVVELALRQASERTAPAYCKTYIARMIGIRRWAAGHLRRPRLTPFRSLSANVFIHALSDILAHNGDLEPKGVFIKSDSTPQRLSNKYVPRIGRARASTVDTSRQRKLSWPKLEKPPICFGVIAYPKVFPFLYVHIIQTTKDVFPV
jgi:hypothetical protein